MKVYHSCLPQALMHLLQAWEVREDEIIYASTHPQLDYGPCLVELVINESEISDSYDYEGGYSSFTGNYSLSVRQILSIRRIR